MKAYKCKACRVPLQLGDKYCHECGREINRDQYGNYLSDLFEERQFAAYRLLPKKLRKEGSSVKGCKHSVHQYRWRLDEIPAVLESVIKHQFSFLRLDIGISFKEVGQKTHLWIHIKPNPRLESESWTESVSRSSQEAHQCIQDLMIVHSSFGGPVSAQGIPTGVIAFCDEFLYEDWAKYHTGFRKEYRSDQPRSGLMLWWFEPISIRDIRRGLAEPDVDDLATRQLEVIQKTWQRI